MRPHGRLLLRHVKRPISLSVRIITIKPGLKGWTRPVTATQ
jgi:hypothetical protein